MSATVNQIAATVEPSSAPNARPRVLIVDDRRENLIALEAVLAPLDADIVCASSGTEAVALSATVEFAVVVLDVMMPGTDGPETARMLKQEGASRLTPVILLTAMDADRRRVEYGYASGAVDYLFKPIDPDVLRAKVSAFVEAFRSSRAERWQQRRRYALEAAAATEAAHRDGDQRFLLLAESVPAMVWTASPHGRVEFMNAFGASYVGVPLSDVRALRWSRLVHPDDLAATRDRWREAVRSGRSYEAEVRIWNAERSGWRRHLARAVPRCDVAGRVLGWVGVNADVEDSIRAEEEAHELQLTAEREARIASDDARRELGDAVGRFERLQSLTTALSQASTPAEVAHAVVTNSVAALGGTAGVVATLAGSDGTPGRTLRVLDAAGYDADVLHGWLEFDLHAAVPIAAAARTGMPQFVASAAALRRDYRDVGDTRVVHAASYSLPLVAQGTVIGAMGVSFRTAPVLTDEDRALADAIARQCAQALLRAELFAAERQARHDAEAAGRRISFLADAGAAIGESLDYRQTLQVLADATVPFLADYAFVDTLDAGGRIERLAYATSDPAMAPLLEQSFTMISGHHPRDGQLHATLVDGRSRLYPHLDPDARAALAHGPEHRQLLSAVGAASLVVVPLRARSRTLGALILARWKDSPRYVDADLRLAEELAQRAAIAIDTARLYEEAQEANRAKAAFLAAVSHDLRQPLNASLGFLDIALMGLRGEVATSLREDLERVRRNQQHLLALINDVLSFARVEAGQLIVRREPVLLEQVLEALPSLVSPQAAAKRVALVIAPCPPALTVIADRDRVVQVFTNLLTNAIKATPEGGVVSVECAAAGDVVLARVRDTGIGIAPEMRDRIFEPFTQVTRSLNRPEEGIGLGLSISRNLARAMGGEISVESTLGEGSTFTLRLPTAESLSSILPAMPSQASLPS